MNDKNVAEIMGVEEGSCLDMYHMNFNKIFPQNISKCTPTKLSYVNMIEQQYQLYR